MKYIPTSVCQQPEKKLIGNILLDRNDSEEEFLRSYLMPKRFSLLTTEDVLRIKSNPYSPPNKAKLEQGFDFERICSNHEEEFKATAKEQSGLNALKEKIAKGTSEQIQMIFDLSVRYADELIEDTNGSQLIYKVIENAPRQTINHLVMSIHGKIAHLSLHPSGCRILQKILEYIDNNQRNRIIQELRGDIRQCMKDPNGNHVIQKCIETGSIAGIDCILATIEDDPYYWSIHPYGTRVVQRVIEFVPHSKINTILQTVTERTIDISKTQFGNYVVQLLIMKGSFQVRKDTIDSFVGKLAVLSKNKFSSIVLEKIVSILNTERVTAFANELFESEDILNLMMNKFANFVIQKLIERANRDTQAMMIQKVVENQQKLKKTLEGKYVLRCVQKFTLDNESQDL